MRTLTVVLIIISFLQTTVLPLDIVLVVLICRSFIKSGRENLYLAFFFGLLISHLTLTPIGVKSILYLLLAQMTQLLSKSRLAGNSLSLIPLSFLLLLINQLTGSFLQSQTLQVFPKVLFESLLSFPVFYLVRLWEERFIIRREIKLRV